MDFDLIEFANEDVQRKGLGRLRREKEGGRWTEVATWKVDSEEVDRIGGHEQVVMYHDRIPSRWWG